MRCQLEEAVIVFASTFRCSRLFVPCLFVRMVSYVPITSVVLVLCSVLLWQSVHARVVLTRAMLARLAFACFSFNLELPASHRHFSCSALVQRESCTMETERNESDRNDNIALLVAAGVTREQAIELLDASGGSIQDALSQVDSLPGAPESTADRTSEVSVSSRNAPSEPGAIRVAGINVASSVPNPALAEEPLVEAQPAVEREELLQELDQLEQDVEDLEQQDQNLPEALVLTQSNETPVGEATSSRAEKKLSPRMRCTALGIVLLAFVGLGVGLGVGLPRQQSADASTTSAPTMSPTTAISSLTELLASVSSDGGESLQIASTPQNEALNWLAGNANLTSYSDEKKIQRFAVATIYYSLNGSNWTDNTGWLSDSDECTWYIENDDGPYCTIEGGVREFDFFHNNLYGSIPPEVGLLAPSLSKYLVLYVLSPSFRLPVSTFNPIHAIRQLNLGLPIMSRGRFQLSLGY